ncbi:MAG: hypothetical protein V3R87_01865, partial [Dehalococcoidia bacterium]
LRVVDRDTGELVMRRRHERGFDAPSFFQVLNLAEDSLSSLLDIISYLCDEQLVEAFGYSLSLGKRSWLIQAAILYEAQQRSVHNDHALEGIARKFEISLRHAQKYALIWKLFFAQDQDDGESVNVDAILLNEPSWYVVAATESPEPHQWLAYAQDRKVQDPRYSVSAFRRDIRVSLMMDGIADVLQVGDAPPATGNRWELWQRCPWVRLHCVQSGRPLPVGQECDACEFSRQPETPFLRNEPILGEEPETAFLRNEPIFDREVRDVGCL